MPGGKVGGVADVIRDLPQAIAARGWSATVVTPSYGALHERVKAAPAGRIATAFGGGTDDVAVYVHTMRPVQHVLLDHPAFVPTTPGTIYHSDPDSRPYATDAGKFACFGAAAAAWVRSLDPAPTIVHLNDWHAAFYLLLREFDTEAAPLKDIRTVFSIHNLAYQGQRPLKGDPSSLERWFPGLEIDVDAVRDPVATDCINPMAFAIRRADAVNTVSPTYAREICRPSDPVRGFFGGEGLEEDLKAAAIAGHLEGILNGCIYPPGRSPRPGWQRIVSLLRQQTEAWQETKPENPAHRLAAERIAALPKRRPLHLLTSIGRLVSQKAALMVEPANGEPTALDAILERLGRQGVLLLIGSGEASIERAVLDVAKRRSNLVFMNGYSESLAEPLYRGGDLFLMPSSFEPCGISQMLAMRDGQPCVVHGVGGLCDTVSDGETGFVFHGDGPSEQAAAFVATVARALELRATHPVSWAGIAQRAEALRFDWDRAARCYIEQVYGRT